jgi:hypothetical protein
MLDLDAEPDPDLFPQKNQDPDPDLMDTGVGSYRMGQSHYH